MEDCVANGSSEVSMTCNDMGSSRNTCGSEVQATLADDQQTDVSCSNATAKEVADCTESLPAVCAVGVEIEVTGSTTAEQNDAKTELVPITATDEEGCSHIDGNQCTVVESAVNGDPVMQCAEPVEKSAAEENCFPADEEEQLEAACAESDHEMQLARKKFSAFYQLDRPASVVIDLRSPPLVQVCLLHGTDDAGAGGSSCGSKPVHWRPQTARRGRRQHSSITRSRVSNLKSRDDEMLAGTRNFQTDDVQTLSTMSAGVNNEKTAHGNENSSPAVSTIIHLKLVEESSDENVTEDGQSDNSRHDRVAPSTDKTVSTNQFRPSCKEQHYNSDSSDDSLMIVRNVNRTYSRNPSDPVVRKYPQLIINAKSDNMRGRKMNAAASSQNAQELTPVPKKFKKTGKPRKRIGPAWFSRQFLSVPPEGVQECHRTLRVMKMHTNPNYNSGVRRRPLVSSPSTVKLKVRVPVSEDSEIGSVSREQLRLSRLSEADVDELQSQLRQEAEHRRSEHIMPLVMQMTDDQIEHAYERVAESMKTYEIVEADSDEDDHVVEDEEQETGGDYELSIPSWDPYAGIHREPVGETEYSKLRPKRHAVDYGPAAFTPILMMEGRRAFGTERRLSKGSRIKSADRAERSPLVQRSQGHRTRRRRRRRSRFSKPLNQDNLFLDATAAKCTDDAEGATGGRVGLFDGLAQDRGDSDIAMTVQENGKKTDSMATQQSLPLLIPAKHVALISAVRSSPPPDLGQPMAPAADESVNDPGGPPLLEPELVHCDRSSSDVTSANLPVDMDSAALSTALCTRATPLASDDGVMTLE